MLADGVEMSFIKSSTLRNRNTKEVTHKDDMSRNTVVWFIEEYL